MTTEKSLSDWQGSIWRKVLWAMPIIILMIPAVAMLFTDQVKWGPASFVLIGAMLFSVCGAIDLAARTTRDPAFRTGVGIAAVTAFLLIWINLAVGIIGNENDSANLMYLGVVGVAISGATLVRFKPQGMVLAMLATAVALVVVAGVALILGDTSAAILTGLFVVPWLVSAWLFHVAARRKSSMSELMQSTIGS